MQLVKLQNIMEIAVDIQTSVLHIWHSWTYRKCHVILYIILYYFTNKYYYYYYTFHIKMCEIITLFCFVVTIKRTNYHNPYV